MFSSYGFANCCSAQIWAGFSGYCDTPVGKNQLKRDLTRSLADRRDSIITVTLDGDQYDKLREAFTSVGFTFRKAKSSHGAGRRVYLGWYMPGVTKKREKPVFQERVFNFSPRY